jgi:hypothetical protein
MRTVYWIGAIAVLVSGLIGLLTYNTMAQQALYDRADPDYGWIKSEFGRRFRGETGDPMDWSRVNGGDWKRLCVFHPYTNPIAAITGMGGTLAPADAARVQVENQPGMFRVAAVGENETLIAYRRTDDRIVVIHLDAVPAMEFRGECYDQEGQ